MATTYTDNLNLQQPDLDDDALITVLNNDMAIIDRAVNGVQNGLAIVANGNTHVAISAGQFVYVRNHTTLTEGLYVASSNIAANATLSTSNLTADSAGGLNALNGNISIISTFNNPVTFESVVTNVVKNVAYKLGKITILELNFNLREVGTGVKIGKLPSNLIPSYAVFGVFSSYSNTHYALSIRIGTNGEISHDSQGTVSGYFSGAVVYFS